MSTDTIPLMPRGLDDKLHAALREALHEAALGGVIGADAAFVCVEVAWEVLLAAGVVAHSMLLLELAAPGAGIGTDGDRITHISLPLEPPA